ncbi:hypothetical protein SDC9_57579 [bioreactor metagenome]|uniref:Uncharacterized protein n=1 Tax=bioreactor metagenome TaxID=1076179 RepID=A0A644X501_9ZZZZ
MGGAAGHDRGTVQCPLLAAGNADADEVDALVAERDLATLGVLVERVAAVDQDVAVLQQRGEGVDGRIGGGTGLDHHHDPAGLLEAGDELFRGPRGEEAGLRMLGHDLLGLLVGTVEDRHPVAVVGEVPGQVRPHHRHADDADACTFSHVLPFVALRPVAIRHALSLALTRKSGTDRASGTRSSVRHRPAPDRNPGTDRNPLPR